MKEDNSENMKIVCGTKGTLANHTTPFETIELIPDYEETITVATPACHYSPFVHTIVCALMTCLPMSNMRYTPQPHPQPNAGNIYPFPLNGWKENLI